jgi:hypothetical protein
MTTPTTQPVATPADLERTLDRIAAAEQAYEDTDPPGPEATNEIDEAAHHLIDQYRRLIDALRPRPVENPRGETFAVTIDGLDIHVTDSGAAEVSVQVNVEDLPAGRTAVVESWDYVSWHQPLP